MLKSLASRPLRRVSLLLLLATLAANYFQVFWVDATHSGVTIQVLGVQEEVDQCLLAGREVKMRFQARLCRRRRSWFDACAEERVQYNTVSFDSITESYKVVKDLLGDEVDPLAEGLPSREEAVKSVVTAENVPFTLLARDSVELIDHQQRYLQARAVFVCKGSINRTLAQLSQILTLGMVNVVESDSGWRDFSINPDQGIDSEGAR